MPHDDQNRRPGDEENPQDGAAVAAGQGNPDEGAPPEDPQPDVVAGGTPGDEGVPDDEVTRHIFEMTKAASDGAPKRKNYERLHGYHGGNLQWFSYGWGRCIKILVLLIAEMRMPPGIAYTRLFKANRLVKEWLYDELVKLVPWLPDKYEQTRGMPLTPQIVYHCWHKQFYTTVPGRGKSYCSDASGVNGRNHPDLQPLLGYMQFLFWRGRPITEDLLRHYCRKAGIAYGRCPQSRPRRRRGRD